MVAFKTKKINSPKTVGSRLTSARKKKKLTLEAAEEITKVRMKYLQAIENDDWREFPSRIYVLGFVRRYADFLDLDSERILEEFKTEFGRSKISRKKSGSRKRLNIFITPKVLISLLVIVVVVGLVSYVVFSVARFSRPPEISILSPVEKITAQSEISIKGETSPTTLIEINNQSVNVDDSGTFMQNVKLIEGLNIFEITAKSRIGKQSSETLKIIYQPKK